jgi:hypothetical protein
MALEPKSVIYAGSDSPVDVFLTPSRRTQDMFTAMWVTTGNIRNVNDIPFAATTVYVFSMALARVTKNTDVREQLTSCVEGIQIPSAFTSIQSLLPLNGSLEIAEYTQLFKFLPIDEATLLNFAANGTLRMAALEISSFANANRVVCISTPIKEIRETATAAKNLQTFTTVEGSFSNPTYDVQANPLPNQVHYGRRGKMLFGTAKNPENPFLWDPFVKDGQPTGCIVSPGRKLNENQATFVLLIFSFWIATDVSLNDARTKHCLRWELSCTSAEVDGLLNRTNIVINNNIPAITLVDSPSNSYGNAIADKDKVKVDPSITTDSQTKNPLDSVGGKKGGKNGASPGPKGNGKGGRGFGKQPPKPDKKE